MVFFNRNFFRSSSSHVLKPQVNKQERKKERKKAANLAPKLSQAQLSL